MPSTPKTPLEKEGEHGYVVLLREQGVCLVELLDVVGAVVGGEGYAGEDDFRSAGFEGAYDLVEVSAGVCDGKAAETVVAAELDDDDGGLEGEDVIEAFDAVFGGVSADALVDDMVVIAAGVEV